jgi:hypothetical protein
VNAQRHPGHAEHAVRARNRKVSQPRFDALARILTHGDELREGVEEGMGGGDHRVELAGLQRIYRTAQGIRIDIRGFFRRKAPESPQALGRSPG